MCVCGVIFRKILFAVYRFGITFWWPTEGWCIQDYTRRGLGPLRAGPGQHQVKKKYQSRKQQIGSPKDKTVHSQQPLCLFMYSVVYLLIPNSYFVLPPSLATVRLFSISVSTRMIFITSLNELTSLSKWFSDFFFKFTFPRVWFYYNILFLSLVQGYFIVIDLCMFLDVILS